MENMTPNELAKLLSKKYVQSKEHLIKEALNRHLHFDTHKISDLGMKDFARDNLQITIDHGGNETYYIKNVPYLYIAAQKDFSLEESPFSITHMYSFIT